METRAGARPRTREHVGGRRGGRVVLPGGPHAVDTTRPYDASFELHTSIRCQFRTTPPHDATLEPHTSTRCIQLRTTRIHTMPPTSKHTSTRCRQLRSTHVHTILPTSNRIKLSRTPQLHWAPFPLQLHPTCGSIGKVQTFQFDLEVAPTLAKHSRKTAHNKIRVVPISLRGG
jgi:hypothetical protein